MFKAQGGTSLAKVLLSCVYSEGSVAGLSLYKEYKYLSNGNLETGIIIIQPVLDLLQNCLAKQER